MSTLRTTNLQHASSTSNNIVLDSSGHASITNDLKFNSGFGSASKAYGVRAWLELDNASGTPSINAHGNVSSITDDNIGRYTVNFTTSFPDTQYVMAGLSQATGTTVNEATCHIRIGVKATGSHTISTTNSNQSTFADNGRNHFMWVR